MTVQIASRGTEERNATTSGNRRRRRMESGEDHEQKKGMRKEEIFGTMERMHGGGRHMGKQRKSKECDGASRRI